MTRRSPCHASSGSSPGIDQLQPATHEIPDISGGQSGATRPGDGGDAGVCFSNRPPSATSARGKFGELVCCGAVEGQHAIRQILREDPVYDFLQRSPPPAIGQQGNALEQLRLGDCRREQRQGRLGGHPFENCG